MPFSLKLDLLMASQGVSILIVLLSAVAASDAAGSVGINYGRVANNLPSPDKVVQLLKSQGVTKVKIFDTDAAVLSALANSGISVVVCLPNEQLATAAGDQSFADNWVQANIAKYYPATKIEAIAIGNEIIGDGVNDQTKALVPAMKAIQASLVKASLDSNIKVSSPIAMSCLGNSYPASAGSFKPVLVDAVIRPMLAFLKQTGSYLMVNVFPFFAYKDNSNRISLDYALFKNNPGVVDSGNGVKYNSLFEAQLDAVYAALSALQYDNMKVEVTETGWPSAGDEAETGASPANAAAYNSNLVRRVLTGNGTPLRPNDPINVYIFALFNENQKPGPTSERNFGLFYPDMQRVYDIPLSQQGLNGNFPQPTNSSSQSPPANNGTGGGVSKTTVGQTWCLANANADQQELQAALDYACGEGGADCGPIQSNGACFNPNTLVAHASYAFNSYYQKKARVSGSCVFNGAAYVSTQPPPFGNCQYPTGH
ncbi:ethylene-responsive transcription factor 3-like [Hibiscus syriacus]|uniref:glucan endo-1,3-beta-D-glucosidase n=1 Tax=Hibiscus syriacus TaxID=106335 RepID=A0A6A3C8K9_HIBSY|nr:glucan endo-1,3-beta-glucosidase 12-like [Hibiscus syriacus]KAE8725473.1 ethylene-responsive transcription factor 3-like [Hibiscus syriacus]